MPITTYDQFIDPLLRYLAAHPERARTGEIQEAPADEMGFSEEEREELLPSDSQAVYKNRKVGGTGDAGIDGVISFDRLGLEKVYIQAKRRPNSAGRPYVHAFDGALARQRAANGVFITTSTFTQQVGGVFRVWSGLCLWMGLG